MPGHKGLFARQFPIAYSCLVHTVVDGFYRHRFDQFAIIQLTLQSWLRFLFPLTSTTCGLPASARRKFRIVICILIHHCPAMRTEVVQ
jgi:hypothetical protein